MASKKGKGKKGGGNNNSNKGGNKKKGPTKFEPIFYNSDIELADNDDDYSLAESFKDLNDLQKQLYEYGWEKKNLEMMDNNGTWKKLSNDELKKFNGKVVKVRDKEIYEEEEEDYGSDEDYSAVAADDDEYGYDPDKDYGDYKDGEVVTKKKDSGPPPMRECIGKLIADMKFNGYERIEAGTLQKASTGETISTKDYILKQASDDEELLSLLVDNIGALDHIIQCLHIDYIWNNVEIEEKKKDDDDDKDEEENSFKDL